MDCRPTWKNGLVSVVMLATLIILTSYMSLDRNIELMQSVSAAVFWKSIELGANTSHIPKYPSNRSHVVHNLKTGSPQCNFTAFHDQLRLNASIPIVPVHLLSGCHNLMYSREAKTGSRTMIQVLRELGNHHGFQVEINIPSKHSYVISEENAKYLANRYQLSRNHLAFISHCLYYDLTPHMNPAPIYVNMLRDPVELFLSFFSFMRYGGDGHHRVRNDPKFDDLDACIYDKTCWQNDKECPIHVMCGQHPVCGAYSKEALTLAIENLQRKYLVVGVMEKYEDYFEVMEYLLPQMFSGGLEMYKKNANHSKVLFKTARKDTVNSTTRAVLKSNLAMEYDLYNAATERFSQILRAVRYLKTNAS